MPYIKSGDKEKKEQMPVSSLWMKIKTQGARGAVTRIPEQGLRRGRSGRCKNIL